MQSSEPSLETLTRRIVHLEAQNRRLKKAGIASLIVATAIIAMAQAPGKKTIEANEFVLRDESGKARARLSLEMKDRPTLTFYTNQNLIAASLAGGDEPFLVLNRAGSIETVQLGANRAFFGMGLYEKEIRAGISVQKGVPGFELYNEQGKPQVSLELSDGPIIIMNDPSFKASLNIGIIPALGGPTITMFGQNKEILWSAP
jgi:hypothetical protein